MPKTNDQTKVIDMQLLDELRNPHAMRQAFVEAMRKDKGNPPQTIDYKNLKIGEKVIIENSSK